MCIYTCLYLYCILFSAACVFRLLVCRLVEDWKSCENTCKILVENSFLDGMQLCLSLLRKCTRCSISFFSGVVTLRGQNYASLWQSMQRGISSSYTVVGGEVLTHSFLTVLVATVPTKLRLYASLQALNNSDEIPTDNHACQHPSSV